MLGSKKEFVITEARTPTQGMAQHANVHSQVWYHSNEIKLSSKMFSDIVSNLKIAISMQTFCDTFEGKVKKWGFQISKLILTF